MNGAHIRVASFGTIASDRCIAPQNRISVSRIRFHEIREIFRQIFFEEFRLRLRQGLVLKKLVKKFKNCQTHNNRFKGI